MKKFFILILGFSILSACKKESQESAFDQSYRRLIRFKNEVKDSYQYTVTNSSWIGTSDTTIITVKRGSVVARKYMFYAPNEQSSHQVLKTSWTETATDINSHQTGAAAITLDEVYAKAKTDWLSVDSKTNKIYFEANNNGMISICGYVPINCMDDCFRGINISNISKVEAFAQ